MTLWSELKKLEKEIPLSPVHKILLTTDGSITRILQALTGEEIKVVTRKQKVIKADNKIAALLKIKTGDEINYRVVNLENSERVLSHAISYIPLKRLKKRFSEDIMKRDIPIGKIMSELKMEARREINDFGIIKYKNKKMLKRNYNIIHNRKIFMNITEIFPYDAFK